MRTRAPLFLLILLSLGSGRAAAQPSPDVDSIFSAPSLDLASLEAGVLARNPSVAAMRSAWQAMEARADRAGAWDDPRADVMVAPQSFGSAAGSAWSVQISQMVPLFGQRSLMGRATRAMADAMREDYRAMRLETLGMTRDLYFQLFLAARSIEVNRELADLLDQFHRVALQKYAAGTVGQQDALQADVELASLEHQLVALGRTRRETQERLRALLHDDTDRSFPDPPRDLPHIEHELADTTYASAAANRPELRSRAATIEARRLEVSAASRMRLPELMLEARYDRFMDMPEWRKMVGAGVSLPIWIGKNNAAVREARSELQRARYEQLAMSDSIRAQVAIARARVRETMHELDIIETRVVPASERALTSVRAGYEANRSDFLALLNAERDLARARLDRYQSIAMVHMALADLERAIGLEPAPLRGEESR